MLRCSIKGNSLLWVNMWVRVCPSHVIVLFNPRWVDCCLNSLLNWQYEINADLFIAWKFYVSN